MLQETTTTKTFKIGDTVLLTDTKQSGKIIALENGRWKVLVYGGAAVLKESSEIQHRQALFGQAITDQDNNQLGINMPYTSLEEENTMANAITMYQDDSGLMHATSESADSANKVNALTTALTEALFGPSPDGNPASMIGMIPAMDLCVAMANDPEATKVVIDDFIASQS